MEQQPLKLFHPHFGSFMEMGLTRDKHFINPKMLYDVIDRVNYVGWHDSNRNYYIDHKEQNETNLIFVTVSGGGILELDNVRYSIQSNTVTVIPCRVKTCYYTDPMQEHWEFYWMHTSGNNITNILSHLYHNHIYTLEINHIRSYTAIFEDILTSALDGIPMTLFNSRKIADFLHLLLEESISRGFILSDNNAFVKTVVQYIEQHYAEQMDLSDMAAAVYMSRENLIRTFRKHTGYTPYAYLKRYRMMRACELLDCTALPIKDIAARVGYSSVSNFIAEFRTVKHITPTQYRKK
ncbi:MAG: helix-turn-helix domain-containing protein [Clostridia bacterium]|nr:helix-turn-helix domain-containing protein [Clostridia bacterium]